LAQTALAGNAKNKALAAGLADPEEMAAEAVDLSNQFQAASIPFYLWGNPWIGLE
jgi:hypothetical protein